MIRIPLPGLPDLEIAHLVLDFNGTMAVGGGLIPGVIDRLTLLSRSVSIHVVTADTFGTASSLVPAESMRLTILEARNQARAKAAYVEELGAIQTAAIGNGRNDEMMMHKVGLAVAVIQAEGAYAKTVAAADMVFHHINDALDAFIHPDRITATLRI
ncbi:ATPase P [bacterium]|nr:ATPase P [bacterium]